MIIMMVLLLLKQIVMILGIRYVESMAKGVDIFLRLDYSLVFTKRSCSSICLVLPTMHRWVIVQRASRSRCC